MLPKVSHTSIVEISRLSDSEKQLFFEKLYDLTIHIFGGVDKEEFEKIISNCGSDESKVQIYMNGFGNWVGYYAIHRFHKTIDSKTVTIFRCQAGLLPEYRRTNASFLFPILEMSKYKLLHSAEEVYMFVSIINPSMYSIANKYSYIVYPAPGKKIPEHIEHIIKQCANEFHFEQQPKDTFWSRSTSWYPLHNRHELDYWKSSNNKYVQYYQYLNPDFLQGKGLLTLIPVESRFPLISLLKAVFYTLKKKIFFSIKPKNKHPETALHPKV